MTSVTHLAPRLASPLQWLLIGICAALLTYGLHHLSPIEGHTLDVLVALVAAVGLTATVASRTAPASRPVSEVVVLRRDHLVAIDDLDRTDLATSARLHEEALPHGFFVELGPRFLRAYHATFVESPHAVAYGAKLGGHGVGFLLGVLDSRANSRWIIRHHGVRLGLLGVAVMVTRPRVGLRFLRTRVRRYADAWRRHRRTDQKPRPAGVLEAPAVLSHIGVAPGARGTGVGKRLTDSFERAVSERGVEWMVLATLAGSDGAGAFYAALGWTRQDSVVSAGGQRFERWKRQVDTSPR